MTVDVDAIRCQAGFWDGLYRPLTRPQTIPAVLGLLAQRLAEAPRGDEEDRFLVRARLSVTGPLADRVWVTATRGGEPVDLRAWAVEHREGLERDGLAPFCAGLEPELEGSFPVDPGEFYARCVPHYDGFLHAWTSMESVRAHYRGWSLERQVRFHHEFVHYAENDRAVGEPEPGLQAAAAWLLPQRRYILQWKLALRERPEPRPAWTRRVEEPLLAAVEALRVRAAEVPSQAWEVPFLGEFLDAPYRTYPGENPTEEVLHRLGCDEGRLLRLRLIHAAYELPGGIVGPLAAEHGRVTQLAREALGWCW
ncbi:MAG: hypothetical protein R3F62_04385 [Planctomycetota bacterium]